MRSQLLVLESRNFPKLFYYGICRRAEQQALRDPVNIRLVQEMKGIVDCSMMERANHERQPEHESGTYFDDIWYSGI